MVTVLNNKRLMKYYYGAAKAFGGSISHCINIIIIHDAYV